MKKIALVAFFALTVGIGYAQVKNGVTPLDKNEVKVEYASVTWDASAHDFGKIKQGVPVTHEFKFTNTGKVPFIITNAQPSCGCTAPDWTKTPVPPGQTGFVKATFNAGMQGPFNKTITVTSNVEGGITLLTIKGEVTITQ
ncbi:MAG: DUF1573 domain-containing protein [Flammeovirgaceae bacterium]